MCRLTGATIVGAVTDGIEKENLEYNTTTKGAGH